MMKTNEMMTFYELAETKEQKQEFASLWSTNPKWRKKGFETDEAEFKGNAYQYFFLNKEGERFGTVELCDFNPDYHNLTATSTVEDLYRFGNLPIVKENMPYVGEIDKLTILGEKSSVRNLRIALSTIVEHSERHEKELMLAHIEPQLFDVLTKVHKVQIDTPTGGAIEHNGYFVVPSVIHMGKIWKNKSDYRWLIKEKTLQTR